MTEANVSVSNKALTLMELSEMSSVKGLVSKDTVNREVFDWLELFLLSQLVKHLRADSSGMCPEEVLSRLLFLPVIAVSF